MLSLLGKLDVAADLHPDAVGGFTRKITQPVECGRHGLSGFNLKPIAGDRLFIRLKNHHPLVAVKNHRFTTGDIRQEGANANDRGNLQSFGNNRRVTARST